MVTVREEINLIISFLEIQKYRFGDKLDYEIHIDHDADECIIPNMALQPFIENASIHGIEPLKENGKIEVHISFDDNLLICKVRDNGVGMSESNKQQLINELENENDMGKSVGIKNVYYRLKLYYQDQFHFQLDSKEGEGTVIIIKIPNQTRKIQKKLKF